MPSGRTQGVGAHLVGQRPERLTERVGIQLRHRQLEGTARVGPGDDLRVEVQRPLAQAGQVGIRCEHDFEPAAGLA